jgi:hypothetical protein
MQTVHLPHRLQATLLLLFLFYLPSVTLLLQAVQEAAVRGLGNLLQVQVAEAALEDTEQGTCLFLLQRRIPLQ